MVSTHTQHYTAHQLYPEHDHEGISHGRDRKMLTNNCENGLMRSSLSSVDGVFGKALVAASIKLCQIEQIEVACWQDDDSLPIINKECSILLPSNDCWRVGGWRSAAQDC